MDFEIIAIFDLRLIKHIFKSNEITWNNLIIHGPFELESMFLEICNPKKRFTLFNAFIKTQKWILTISTMSKLWYIPTTIFFNTVFANIGPRNLLASI